jgi:hypothetical protein
LLLEQTNLGAEVELEVHPDQIVVRATHQPRSTWENAFKEMASRGDDELLDGETYLSKWDTEAWEW